MKSILINALLFLSISAFAQSKTGMDVCCVSYQDTIMRFSIVNNADTNVKFIFGQIDEFQGKEIIKSFEIYGDTICASFLPAKESLLEASGQVYYTLDNNFYFQSEILAHDKLDIYTRISKKEYKKLKYLKIILPNQRTLIKAVK